MTQQTLIQDLDSRLQALIRITKQELQPLDGEGLNWKAAAESWSILECLEHLNRYFRYYNPLLKEQLHHAQQFPNSKDYASNWVGKQSIKSIHPQNVKKTKTMARYNPGNSQLDESVIREFTKHLEQLAGLLQQAETTNLRAKKIPIEFFKLLRLQIGDTFIFLIYHAQRHVNQALDVKKAMQGATAQA